MTPHLIWLFDNEFVTIFYGLNRSGVSDHEIYNHLKNPFIFFLKQLVVLLPFFLMFLVLLKNFRFHINFKSKKNLFLITITVLPIFLVLITSLITGAKIRTMWMTPFYLFFGTLFFEIFKNYVDLKKLKSFI